jgi:tetratricopeptide (TPR) repeat protein
MILEYAVVLHKNEKSEEALQRLHAVTTRAVPMPGALLLQARIQFDSGHLEEARNAVRALLKVTDEGTHREDAESLLARIEKGMLSTEVAAAIEAAGADPDNLGLQLNALAKLLEGSHPEKVIPLVDQTISRHPASRDQVIDYLAKAALRPDVPFPVLNLLADLLVARTRFDEALDIVRLMADRSIDKVGAMRDGAQKILRRSPHHLATLRALGDRYLAYGRFTEMIHSYALYLSHGGGETEQIDAALAKAYLNLGDYENAKRFVNQLLSQKADNIPLLQQVIPLALEANRPEEAAEFMKKLEIAAPRDQDTRALKEKVSAGLGERRLAYLKKEMEAGRGDSSTLEQLGDVARSIGNYGDGITYYQRASRDRENPSLSKRCVTKLALCYTHKRLDDLASETLRDLTVSLDDNPEDLAAIMDTLYEIGDLFLEMRLYAKAERVFKQLCKIDAGYRDVLAKVESLRV